MTQDTTTQETETLASFDRSKKVSNRSTEVKILTRGDYYLTPFTLGHIDEVAENLSSENKRELILIGHTNVKEALYEMHESSECYITRRNDENFLMVGGLWYDGTKDAQMFAMFSEGLKQNFHALARGSKLLVNFFDQAEEIITMSVLAEYEPILNWASWLGFEAVGVTERNSYKYVEFVRCNPTKKLVYNESLRPVMH